LRTKGCRVTICWSFFEVDRSLTAESGYTFNEDIRNKVQALMGQLEKEKGKFEVSDVNKLIKLIQTEKENEEMGDERADYSKDGVR
jgi:hypothetical protein